ncbi:MAG: hypothetical protein NTW98_00130 [Candidatus Nomurabacteria bacterium]|nr:hypothetical protein [Candidatus Nomurabacteria bacterium]
MDTKNLLKVKTIFFSFVFVSILFFGSNTVDAATLRMSPGSADLNVGGTTTLSVVVNSEGVPVNNAEGTISFASDLFEIVSISKAGSVFSLWIEEPTFSNSSGTITFNGGVPTPGFNGSAGRVLSFVVRAKKAGSGEFSFSSSAVRANDGLGTDILTSRTISEINIKSVLPKEVETAPKPKVEVKPTVPPVNSTLQAPVIISSTNPDQEAWYSSTSATFNWDIPSTATLIQTAYNKTPDSIPTITYDSSVSQKTLTGLLDRVFYFHLRYQDGGKWSPVAHYKFKIDTLAPEPFTPTVRAFEGKNLLKLEATDASSGIDRYSVQIDEKPIVIVSPNELINNEYTLPILTEGQHNLTVIAYDKAGNNRNVKAVFKNSFAIESPVITVNPSEVFVGEVTTVSGQTKYPQTKILVTVMLSNNEIQTYESTTDANGVFTVTTDKFKVFGMAEIFAVNMIADGVNSEASEKIQLKVNDKDMIRFSVHRDWLLGMAGGIGFLLLILLIGWIKYFRLKHMSKKLTGRHPIEDIYNATVLLKEELSKQIKILDKIKSDGTLGRIEEEALNEIQHKEQSIIKEMQKK